MLCAGKASSGPADRFPAGAGHAGAQPPGIGMLRVIEDLRGAAALYDLASVEHDGLEAAMIYRALADFTLGFCGGEAALLALPEPLQTVDRAAWSQAYRAVDGGEYPHIWRVRDELPLVTDDEIFEAILEIVITGLCERAPRPCTCGAHPGGGAAR